MSIENQGTSGPSPLELETPARKQRVAQYEIFNVAENLKNMSPGELKNIVDHPQSVLSDEKAPNIKSELFGLKSKALAWGFEDGIIWTAKKFKAGDENPKFTENPQAKAENIKIGIQLLQGMINEWNAILSDPDFAKRKDDINELISAAKNKIKEKLPESAIVSQAALNQILDTFTLSQDRDRTRADLKGFIDDCDIKLADKNVGTKTAEITKLKSDAEGFLMRI